MDLHVRFQQDLILKNFSPTTQRCYASRLKHFAVYFKHSLEQINSEHIRTYLLHLICERQVSKGLVNQAYSALKFFYEVTLERDWTNIRIPRPKGRRTLPVVLSIEEVQQLLDAVHLLKHQALLTTMYSAGLGV